MVKPTKRCTGSILAAALVAVTLIGFASAQNSPPLYTKLSPSDPIIHLVNGEGTERFYFLKAKGEPDPRIRITNATGHTNTISGADIHADAAISIDTDTLAIPISVKTQAYVEPGTAYESNILLYGKHEDQPPVVIKFKIEDDSVTGFELEPASIVATIGDADSARQRIRIKNTGKTPIASLKITSSTLADAGNQHRTQMTPVPQNIVISPGQYADLDFVLPQPPMAGTYTGTIFVLGNSNSQRSVGLTLQTRGPYSGYYHLPFILFVTVVAAGFALSSILDAWFGSGGLAKAQAYLTIKTAESQLTDVKSEIVKWKPGAATLTPPCSIPQTDLWIAKALLDIQNVWESFDTDPVEELTTSSQQFYVLGSASKSLWAAVTAAMSELAKNPAPLQKAISGIDSVKLPSSRADLARYRQDLSVVVTAAGGAAMQAASVVASVGINVKRTTTAMMRDRISGMNWLYQTAVASVVFITAYQVFYAQKWTFGTVSDYLAVFLWALGLTTTGTQILARVHKP